MRASLLLLALFVAAPAVAQPLALESPDPRRFGSFGGRVAAVPDADGDGRSDFLVNDQGPSFMGLVRLYSGATGALIRTLQSPTPEADGFFGIAVAGVPDSDGDGRGDLLVGAGGEGGGRAYLFSRATGALLHTLSSPNPEPDGSSGFGEAVAGVADADGDGRGDFGVGASFENGRGVQQSGRAYVFGGATGAPLFRLQSPNAEEFGRFGEAGAGRGDVDGDGLGDGVVGANGEDVGGVVNAGRAYLYRTGGAGGVWGGAEAVAAGEPGAEVPAALALSAGPNPFASTTTLRVALARPAEVTVEVLDVLGRRVALVYEGALPAGGHRLRWEPAAGVPGGAYLVRLRVAGAPVQTLRLTLVR